MLSSMLKKIEREEDNVVHGYKRPQVTSHRRRVGDFHTTSRTANTTPPTYSQTSAAVVLLQEHSPPSPNNASKKRTCVVSTKGPKTVDIRSFYRRSSYHRSLVQSVMNTHKKGKRVFLSTSYVPSESHDDWLSPSSSSHTKVVAMTPAYTPKYVPGVLETSQNRQHHTVMTPSYTPNYYGGAVGRSGSYVTSSSTTTPRSRNMKRSVMYTPKYDPMYFVGAEDDHDNHEGSAGDDTTSRVGASSSFVASPTTPKYTPTSPVFLELVSAAGHTTSGVPPGAGP